MLSLSVFDVIFFCFFDVFFLVALQFFMYFIFQPVSC